MPQVVANVDESTAEQLKTIKNHLGMTQADVAGVAIRLSMLDKELLISEVIDVKKSEVEEELRDEEEFPEEGELFQ